MGGVGTIFGAIIGSLIMASLTSGLQMMNVPAAWQYILKGVVLIIAVYRRRILKEKSTINNKGTNNERYCRPKAR